MMEDTTAEIEQELDTGILPRETVEVNDHDRGELKKLDPPSVALYQEYCDAQQNALDISDDLKQFPILVGDALYEKLVTNVTGDSRLTAKEQAELGLRFMADRRETIKTVGQIVTSDRREKAKENRRNTRTNTACTLLLVYLVLPDSVREKAYEGVRLGVSSFFRLVGIKI